MTQARPTLLLTRPQAAAERFVKGLDPSLVRRIEVVISPLIRIELSTDPINPGKARGLIFSSSNGVLAAAQCLPSRDLPAYCVGSSTTRAAQDAGWRAVWAGPDADGLVASLLDCRPAAPLLHLHGRHARGDIAQRLTQGGLPTQEQVVYDQPVQPLSARAKAVLAGPGLVIAPVFSPRTAALLSDATDRPLTAIALSLAVSAALGDKSNWNIHTAAAPDASSIGALVEKLLQSELPG